MLQKTAQNRRKNRLQKTAAAEGVKRQKRRNWPVISDSIIRGTKVRRAEVNKYEYCITEHMPADERPLDGCRREGQGDFPKSPQGGIQNPFNEP